MIRKAIRRIVCLIIMLTLSVSAGAVLKEKNLKSTLSVLCAELEGGAHALLAEAGLHL